MSKMIPLLIAINILITAENAICANSTHTCNESKKTVACWKQSKSACAESAGFSVVSLDALVSAIAQIESGGRSDIIGDNGRAIGMFQLHEIAVRHCNEKFKTNYVWPQDALNPVTARKIVKLYLGILGYNKKPLEMVIRRYNAGKHWQCEAAGRYWKKIQKQLR